MDMLLQGCMVPNKPTDTPGALRVVFWLSPLAMSINYQNRGHQQLSNLICHSFMMILQNVYIIFVCIVLFFRSTQPYDRMLQ